MNLAELPRRGGLCMLSVGHTVPNNTAVQILSHHLFVRPQAFYPNDNIWLITLPLICQRSWSLKDMVYSMALDVFSLDIVGTLSDSF